METEYRTPRRGVLVVLLFLMPLVAYLPALDGDFVWDDDYNVTENPHLRDLDGLQRIWLDTRSTQQYYPLTHTSFWIDYQLWGLHPLGYHLGNVLLHAGSAVLLWLVLLELGVPGAWLAAAVFALHPVHVESVAWITERKNTLSALCYLSAALAYLRFALREDTSSRRGIRLALAACVLFACALLAKTVTSTLPVALALLVWWKRGRLGRRHLAWLGSMLVAGAAMGLLTLSLETHSVGAQGSEFSLSVGERIIVAGRALWFYLGKLLWPVDLAFSYSRWHVDAGLARQYLYSGAAAAAAAALWMLRRRLGAGPFVAAAYFAITVSPALGFVNVFYSRYAFVADHFQYLASIGPIALLAATASRLKLPPIVARVLFSLLLLALGALTWQQARSYEDQETLWRRSIAADPRSFMAHYNLGELLDRKGAMREALAHYHEALRINPEWSDALVNIGSILGRQGKTDEALQYFDRAIEIAPDHALTHFDRGLALEMKGRTDLALAAYREAIRLEDDLVQAHNNLALLLHALGDHEGAWKEVHRTRELGGTFQSAFLRQLSEKLADPRRVGPRSPE
jgi:tetratricopeptide (TPR) repeat protein